MRASFGYKELATYTSTGEQTWRNLVADGKCPIPYFKFGKRILFAKADVDKWIERQPRYGGRIAKK